MSKQFNQKINYVLWTILLLLKLPPHAIIPSFSPNKYNFSCFNFNCFKSNLEFITTTNMRRGTKRVLPDLVSSLHSVIRITCGIIARQLNCEDILEFSEFRLAFYVVRTCSTVCSTVSSTASSTLCSTLSSTVSSTAVSTDSSTASSTTTSTIADAIANYCVSGKSSILPQTFLMFWFCLKFALLLASMIQCQKYFYLVSFVTHDAFKRYIRKL